MQITILKHISFEEPGYFLDIFEKMGAHTTIVELYSGMNPFDYPADALVIMGGPMSIHDHDRYPWLEPEKIYIQSFIDSGKPVIGVCLGAQLIASCLGARVYPNKYQEIGWFTLQKTVTGVMDFLPDFTTVFHWHGDTFDLPKNATRIYSSTATENQAFTWGKNVLAIQFHLEMTPEIMEELAGDNEDYYDGTEFVMKIDEIISAYPNYRYSNQKILSGMVRYLFISNGLLKS